MLPVLLALSVELLHTEAEVEREPVPDRLPERLAEAQLLPVLEAQEELEAEGEAEAEEFRDRVGAELTLLRELRLGVELLEPEAEPLGEGDTLLLPEALGLAAAERLAEALTELVPVPQLLRLVLAVALLEVLPLVEAEPEREALTELVLQAVEEELALTEALLLREPVELTLGLPEAVIDWLRVALPEADLEAEGEPLTEAE